MTQQIRSSEPGLGTEGEACCAVLSDISTSVIEQEVDILAALANPTRYGAIQLLADADEEICACDIAPPLDVSQSTISHALGRLHDAGLVERRKQGRWRYYRTTPLAEAVIDVFDSRAQQGGRV